MTLARENQPTREDLYAFFMGRRWRGDLYCPDASRAALRTAVDYGLGLQKSTGKPFVWLCCTNRGVETINKVAIDLLGLDDARKGNGYPTDPNAGESLRFYAHPGVYVRLTRNVDKDRGFVNGATGVVKRVLSCEDGIPNVFTVELSTGVHVLVHPVRHNKKLFLPCTYGYATTIRKAQGATYDHGAIWFDHCYPPERGYGYVAASRFRKKAGIYLVRQGPPH